MGHGGGGGGRRVSDGEGSTFPGAVAEGPLWLPEGCFFYLHAERLSGEG